MATPMAGHNPFGGAGLPNLENDSDDHQEGQHSVDSRLMQALWDADSTSEDLGRLLTHGIDSAEAFLETPRSELIAMGLNAKLVDTVRASLLQVPLGIAQEAPDEDFRGEAGFATAVRATPIPLPNPTDEPPANTIYFYHLQDKFGELSNFYWAPFALKGRVWATPEHYFQAHKFLPDHPELYDQIWAAKRPREAFNLGRGNPNLVRQDWFQVNEEVMMEALMAKFITHDELRDMLIATSPKILVEHTVNDSHWGDGGDGNGRNRLGVLLMAVREKLKDEERYPRAQNLPPFRVPRCIVCRRRPPKIGEDEAPKCEDWSDIPKNDKKPIDEDRLYCSPECKLKKQQQPRHGPSRFQNTELGRGEHATTTTVISACRGGRGGYSSYGPSTSSSTHSTPPPPFGGPPLSSAVPGNSMGWHDEELIPIFDNDEFHGHGDGDEFNDFDDGDDDMLSWDWLDCDPHGGK